ncbi:hypothetical protein SAMN05446927_5407 [Caballeronia arationis]|uniref:Uncharacterized protein n=1 Tax=Caballeronia arationis TaxID=1777142 RepID=A0A7Z7ICM5_9BURK|nr:hypothetical protein [Caballeronia arationis]SOE82096.1 hypothetical protein SAMN05446927_5407 [Caballeronia arationis]
MNPQPIVTQCKDPSAVLDFALDLAPAPSINASPWLAQGETVTTLIVTADTGITVNSSSISTNSLGVAASLLVAWLSGGTAGTTYNVRFTFVTSRGRRDSRTMPVRVVQR